MNAPLHGAVIAVTRATEQAGPLVERLLALGADIVEIPVVAIVDPSDGGAGLAAAIDDLHSYDWVVLTSPNAARRFATATADVVDSRMPKLAAVGPGTASVLVNAGRRIELVPERTIGEGLVDAFPHGPGRVLLPRAAAARDVVPVGLRAKGWTVDIVTSYRTVPVAPSADDVARLAEANLVCFTSSSTVDALVDAVGVDALPNRVVSMGPATSATAKGRGVSVGVTAEPSTLDGFLDAIVACWEQGSSGFPCEQ